MEFTRGPIQKVWTPGSLSGADAIAEAVAAKGKSNLYRTSCYFKDRERYRSCCALYAVLRLVSDRVKTFLVGGDDCSGELCQEFIVVQAWRRVIAALATGHDPVEQDIQQIGIPRLDEVLVSFGEATKRFPIPERLWSAFVTAMEHDLQHHRSPFGNGAGLVPTDHADLAQLLKRPRARAYDSVGRRSSQGQRRGHWRRQTDGARACDDQDRQAVDEAR